MLSLENFYLETKYYPPVPASEFPSLFDPDGCYPYVQFCDTEQDGQLIQLNCVRLENDFLVAIVCPDLNGRLLSLVHKQSGKEALYRNDVVKPNRILPRWGWFSGGIEFNYPIAHSPTALEKVGYRTCITKGRVAVQCGETERKYGLSWIVELSLGENEDYLTQRSFFKNSGSVVRPWCFWTNAAVRSTPKTHYLYPPAKVLRHADVCDYVQWPEIGEREKDFDRMTGLFWTAQGNGFGVWHPEEEIGLVHMSDPSTLRGMKFWTYGVGKHSHWPLLFCDESGPYAEIQSGVAPDQATEMFLQPGEERQYIEFWSPVINEPDITQLQIPAPTGEFPPCKWLGHDHIPEVAEWDEVLAEVSAGTPAEKILVPRSPAPPLPEYLNALRTLYKQNPDHWRSQYATYLCGVMEFEKTYLHQTPDYSEVLQILDQCTSAAELRLKGLILARGCGNGKEAVSYLRQAHCLSKDVRLAIEYDMCLADAGPEFAQERSDLHAHYSTADRRWTERKVAFLLDNYKPAEAKNLLLSTKWDLYHLRQVRTTLYRKIQTALGLPVDPIPAQLGEDDMADWGAYRPGSTDGKKVLVND